VGTTGGYEDATLGGSKRPKGPALMKSWCVSGGRGRSQRKKVAVAGGGRDKRGVFIVRQIQRGKEGPKGSAAEKVITEVLRVARREVKQLL